MPKVVSGESWTFSRTIIAIASLFGSFLFERAFKRTNLVAQYSCSFEIERISCIMHFSALLRYYFFRVPAECRDIRACKCIDGTFSGPLDVSDYIVNALLYRFRSDSVFLVVCHLSFPSPVRLPDSALHRARHLIGVEDNATMHITRRTADCLNERGLTPQEPFFICIENTDELYLRQIEPFA